MWFEGFSITCIAYEQVKDLARAFVLCLSSSTQAFPVGSHYEGP